MSRRAFDVILCLVALPVMLVVGAAIALAVVLDSPGPIFYRARRIGRHGKPFTMLKFRTMQHGAVGPPLSCEGDERYTPLGLWLARHRLDELPQIWNVLRGEMRLVGPRPEVEEFVTAHPEQYARIHTVLPGLTGPAQLQYAFEGELLAAATDRVAAYRDNILPAKIDIDLEYLDGSGLRRDVSLMLRTVVLPVRRLRRYALMLGAAQPTPGPTTRAMLVLSLVVATMTTLFAVEVASI